MSDDQGYTDIVICLPSVDNSTDDKEGLDDVTGIVNVQDVSGTVEIHYLSLEACENKEQTHSLPTTTQSMEEQNV
jgi:hypothetical protein